MTDESARLEQGYHSPDLFARIPRVLLRDPSVSIHAKILWASIDDYTDKGSSAWPGQQTIADHLGVSRQTVSGWLSQLIDAEWVSVERTMKRGNVYYLNWRKPLDSAMSRKPDIPETRDVKKTRQPMSKKPDMKKNHEGEKTLTTPPTPPGGREQAGTLFDQGTVGGDVTHASKIDPKSDFVAEMFERWWSSYPSQSSRGSKQAALRAWRKAMKRSGVTSQVMFARLVNYTLARQTFRDEHRQWPPLMNASTFINSKSEMFDVEWPLEECTGYWPVVKEVQESVHDIAAREVAAARAAKAAKGNG